MKFSDESLKSKKGMLITIAIIIFVIGFSVVVGIFSGDARTTLVSSSDNVERVYVGEDGHSVMIETGKGEVIRLDEKVNQKLEVVGSTSDNEWVIVSSLPSKVETGKIVEAIPLLYSTRLGIRSDYEIIEKERAIFIGFTDDDRYVIAYNRSTGKNEEIELVKLYDQLLGHRVCEDSDQWETFYKKGTTRWYVGGDWHEEEDYCMKDSSNNSEDKRVVEFSCPGGEMKYYTCPSGCMDGACVEYQGE